MSETILFDDANNKDQRYTVLPIQYPELWHAYKRQLASFWSPEEIDFSQDRKQWQEKLTEDERTFIRGILTFFAASDTVVSLNLMNSFCKEVCVLEAQIAYTYQAMIENIHAEVYSTQIDTCIRDPEEKRRIFESMGESKTVQDKVAWAKTWASSDTPFANRLLAFAIVEGLFFSGAFCAIYWIKQRNLMPGLTKSNEFIARDEGQHTDFACLLYSMLRNTRVPEEDVRQTFREAVEIEKHFILEVIPCRMVGMNSDLMSQYIEYVADGLLVKLGYSVMYETANPFPFMNLIGMSGRSNFFEERVSLYQRANVMAQANALVGNNGDGVNASYSFGGDQDGGASDKQGGGVNAFISDDF